MRFSKKSKDFKVYKFIKKIFFKSFFKNIYFKLNPWHNSSKLRKLEKEIAFLKNKYENDFLKDAKGVIHVGANLGQERYIYDYFMLDVIWFEPIPVIFNKLKENLREFPNQIAFKNLITDKDKKSYDFF